MASGSLIVRQTGAEARVVRPKLLIAIQTVNVVAGNQANLRVPLPVAVAVAVARFHRKTGRSTVLRTDMDDDALRSRKRYLITLESKWHLV